ncbi:MAG: hypothetical protein AABX70_08560 [Nanoarchaeota archaeon]
MHGFKVLGGFGLVWVVFLIVLSGCGNSAPSTPPTNCSDHIQNQNESDVDCGGPSCGKCISGKACLFGVDCESTNCVEKVCKALSTCTDTLKNQDESDADCGGKICRACINGKACSGNEDCDSKYCSKGICATLPPPASCTDSLKNQDETDLNCGGVKCPKCALGKSCSADADCAGNSTCMEGECATPTSCSDHVKNGKETDTDCGGSSCKKCTVGKACEANTDCFSNQCDKESKKCKGSTGGSCRDLTQNQDESDADCGGSKCQKCQVSKMCKIAEDCQSNYCLEGKCWNAPPKTCLDTVKGGDETDIDCGGAQCGPCKSGKSCRLGSDCATQICASKVCQ